MGQVLSDLIKDKKASNEAQAVHDLEMLQKLVDSQLDKFEAGLDAKFLNPDSTSKIEVPGIRALRKKRYSACQVDNKPSKEVDDAIDKFFGAAKGGDKTKENILDGFKSLVKAALNQFFGNTSIGEHNESQYFVYMHHNTVIRVDIKLWRWNFTDQGLGLTYKNALGYYMCVSVVDVGALKVPEFVYLISEYAGDEEEAVLKYTASMAKMYEEARKMKKEQEEPSRPPVRD